MEIRWLGQSTFEIKTAAGTVITDPYSGVFDNGGELDPNTVVLISRKPQGKPVQLPESVHVFDRPGEYETGGLIVRGVGTPAGDPASSREVNTVFLVAAEGVSVCVLGQTATALDTQALQAVTPVDVALVNASGGLPADQKAAVIRQLDPKFAVPAGYDSQAGAPGQQLGRLLKELGVKQADPQPRLSVSKANLPPDLKVVVLSART